MFSSVASKSDTITIMKIIGIDPGYERLGISIVDVDEDKKEALLFSECFQTSSALDFNSRLALIGTEMVKIITEYKPDVLAIEKLYFTNNQKTAIGVAEVIGAIIYIAKSNNLTVHEYTPLQIKSAIAGSGRGTKKDVITMLHRLIKIEKKIKYDDEYDAIAVALTCSAIERF